MTSKQFKKNRKKSKFVNQPVSEQLLNQEINEQGTNNNNKKKEIFLGTNLRKANKLETSSKDNKENSSTSNSSRENQSVNKLNESLNDCCCIEKADLNGNHSKSENKIKESPKGPKESKSLGPFENIAYDNPKKSKSVLFTNQVTIAYFNGDNILCESKEPLKKELDQQLRNKEMRKEHLTKFKETDNVYLF